MQNSVILSRTGHHGLAIAKRIAGFDKKESLSDRTILSLTLKRDAMQIMPMLKDIEGYDKLIRLVGKTRSC
jgi:hypothetical protein